MIALVLGGYALLAAAMAALYLRQLRTRDATSVDAAWAGGLLVLAILYASLGDGPIARRALVGAIAGIWAGRLALHLLADRVLGRRGEEDGRYRALRERWGDAAPFRFFLFYQAQALVAAVFSLPFLAAMSREGPLGAPDWAGLLVAAAAIALESVADRQLARFRRDPSNRGKTCRDGLWAFSRHPNYFFEWVHWFAYVAIGRGAPLTFIGPVLMFLFLFRLTGIPYTEAQALRSRGDDYRDYQRTTSVFFPRFPKAGAAKERGPR